MKLLAGMLVCASVAAQDAATTLLRLCERASLIAQVRVLDVRLHGDEMLVTLRTLHALRGAAPACFVLREPGGDACGRALAGLLPGSGMLAFLERAPGGATLVCPSPRALVALEPGLVAHVAALCAAGRRELPSLLATALGASSPRVATDAALALAELEQLGNLSVAGRAGLLQALRTATGARTLPALVTAAARLQLPEAVPMFVDRWLTGAEDGCRRLHRDALLQFPPALVVAEIAARQPRGQHAQLRAVQLLELLPAAEAADRLLAIARSGEPAAAVHAAAALLRAGLGADALPPELGAERKALAERLAAPAPPRFRAIRPAAVPGRGER